MKSTLKLLFLPLVLVMIFCVAKAQHSGDRKLFEFEVKGMQSDKDAKALDSLYLTKVGIFSSKTDFKTKMIKLETIPQLDFKTVKGVLTVLRLEATDEKLKVPTVAGE